MDEQMIDQFHLLRPAWLLVVPIAIWVHYKLRRKFNSTVQWQDVIEPHLLAHLTVAGTEQQRIRPYQLMTAVLVLSSIALAGPTWQREITPFTKDRAPLIVALELTPTMLGTDQKPYRLERAKQKIRDILERRKGARTAVIGYAGSAHAVLPLTDDIALIELYLESLTPALMPKDGDNAISALSLAQTMLEGEEVAGTIVFITDGIDRTYAPKFSELTAGSIHQILILAIGTKTGGPIASKASEGKTFGLLDGNAPPIDLGGLETIADAIGGRVIRATPDTSDIDVLMRDVQSHLINTIQEDEKLQWRDFGYVLIWPLALIILMWARRGWTVRWA